MGNPSLDSSFIHVHISPQTRRDYVVTMSLHLMHPSESKAPLQPSVEGPE